jgi:hypothetical protein
MSAVWPRPGSPDCQPMGPAQVAESGILIMDEAPNALDNATLERVACKGSFAELPRGGHLPVAKE